MWISNPVRGKRVAPSLNHPDRLCGPPSLLLNGDRGSFQVGGGKQPGREINHSPASSIEFKNEWSCTSTAVPICLHGVDRHNFTFLFF